MHIVNMKYRNTEIQKYKTFSEQYVHCKYEIQKHRGTEMGNSV